MKARFNEILKNYCDEYGVTEKQVLGHERTPPLPEVRARIIKSYKDQYPSSTWKCIGMWMNRDHSSVINAYYNADNKIYDNHNLLVLDYSKFVSFGYDEKIRFKHRYV